MKRASLVLAVAVLAVACQSTPSSQPPDQSQAAGQSQAQGASQAPSAGGGGGGGGASLVEAANAVTDWCTLMPADLVAELVPGASEPVSGEFPLSCTVSNEVQVVQVSYQGSSGAEPDPAATLLPGIAESAWLAVGYPTDDPFLTVILGRDPNGLGNSTLYVEVAGHDGIDHGDDAIAVARAVIAQLR